MEKTREEMRDEILVQIVTASGIIKFVCGVGNNTALLTLYDAVDAVKREPGCYRHEIKRRMKMVLNEVKNYEHRLIYDETNRFFRVSDMSEETRRQYAESMTDKDYYELWCNLNSKIYVDVKPFLDSLKHKYFKLLQKYGCKYSKAASYLCVSLTMMKIADSMYESALSSVTHESYLTSSVARELFGKFSMKRVSSELNEVLSRLLPEEMKTKLPAEDQRNLDLGLSQVEERMMNIDNLFDSMKYAVEDFPELFRTKGFQKKALQSIVETQSKAKELIK